MICETPTRAYPNGRTGTGAGYQAHKYAGEAPCGACRDASTAQRKTWPKADTRTTAMRAAYNTGWRKTALERDPLYERRANLKAKFGLDLEDYDRMLAEQCGKCASCGTTSTGSNTFFAVDHDHGCCPGKKSCGKCVRGLLCANCNLGLGQFGDDPDRLMAAVAYLLSRQNVLIDSGRR